MSIFTYHLAFPDSNRASSEVQHGGIPRPGALACKGVLGAGSQVLEPKEVGAGSWGSFQGAIRGLVRTTVA